MRRGLEYLLVRSLQAIVGVLPDPLVRAWGDALGALFFILDRPHRRVAEDNLARAFPSRSDAERRAIVRAAFKHFGRLLFEILKFSTL